MTLSFPNQSRSFDATKKRVSFWGYDRVMEVSFFVEAGVLQKLCPEMESTESGFLKAFDSARKRIYEVAQKVYAHGRKGASAYILTEKEF